MLAILTPVLIGILLPAFTAAGLAAVKGVPTLIGRLLLAAALFFGLSHWGVVMTMTPSETMQLWLWIIPFFPFLGMALHAKLKLLIVLGICLGLSYMQLRPFIEYDWSLWKSIGILCLGGGGLLGTYFAYYELWDRVGTKGEWKLLSFLIGILALGAVKVFISGNLLLSHFILFLMIYVGCRLVLLYIATRAEKIGPVSWIKNSRKGFDLGLIVLFFHSLLLEAYWFSEFGSVYWLVPFFAVVPLGFLKKKGS